MVGWLKALLFVAGGVAAAAGTAYLTGLLDPMLGRQPQVVASLPQGQQAPQEQTPAATEETVPLPEDGPQATEKQGRVVAPTFDLLRVEPNGSMLIAGKAAGGATVEVLDGDNVLVSTKAEPSGDFVAVLDEPLPAGDYRLSLRASAEGDEPTLSSQTAIVSVPATADGQVLAMVEAPGQAAELITVPQAPSTPAPQDDETEIAAAPQTDAPPAAGTNAPQTVAEGDEELAKEPQPAAEETVEAPAGDVPGDEIAATDESQTGADEAPVVQEQISGQESQTADQQDAAPAAEEPDATETVASEENAPAEAAGQTPAIDLTVVVEAVEIEGDTIFVAGQAAPGHTVRVYADETLIGDAVVSEGGRFLVEERRELAVGSYTIRADLLDASGAVLARAAVPFEREAGEAIAAVAPQPQAPEQPAAGTDAQDAPAAGEPAADAQPGDTNVAAGQGGAEATAPALQRVDGAVIIRRGDSLWRISRRVYGRGVRYSTIYLANQDQITDPNRIWPGQVFAVPRETSDGEQADMEAIGDQAVTRDGQPAAQ